MTDEPRITAAEAMRRAETLADRMNAANERREAYRQKQDAAALDRPSNATDKRLDDAVEAGDVQGLAALADRGIIEPNDARLAADVVKYDHPENRTRSVLLADQALHAVRYPHAMDRVADEVRPTVTVIDIANPEPSHIIQDAIINKAFERMLEGPEFTEQTNSDPAPVQTAGAAFREMDNSPRETEPDRPVERLVQGLRL